MENELNLSKANTEQEYPMYDIHEYSGKQESVDEQRKRYGEPLEPEKESEISKILKRGAKDVDNDPREKVLFMEKTIENLSKGYEFEKMLELDILFDKSYGDGQFIDDYQLVKDGISRENLLLMQKAGKRPTVDFWKINIEKAAEYYDNPANSLAELWLEKYIDDPDGKVTYKPAGVADDVDLPEDQKDVEEDENGNKDVTLNDSFYKKAHECSCMEVKKDIDPIVPEDMHAKNHQKKKDGFIDDAAKNNDITGPNGEDLEKSFDYNNLKEVLKKEYSKGE